jgi:hypothetical protein
MAKTRHVLDRIPLAEAAPRTGFTPDRIRAYVRAGILPCYRVGERGWMYFDPADIDAFVESLRRPGGVRGAA